MSQVPSLLVDARVRSVPWRDLVTLRTGERLRELFFPVPWLLLGLFAAQHSLWFLSLAGSFYSFLPAYGWCMTPFTEILGSGPGATTWPWRC